MNLKLNKNTFHVMCDSFNCHNRAAYYVARPDGPRNGAYNCCVDCAKHLVAHLPEELLEFLAAEKEAKTIETAKTLEGEWLKQEKEREEQDQTSDDSGQQDQTSDDSGQQDQNLVQDQDPVQTDQDQPSDDSGQQDPNVVQHQQTSLVDDVVFQVKAEGEIVYSGFDERAAVEVMKENKGAVLTRMENGQVEGTYTLNRGKLKPVE